MVKSGAFLEVEVADGSGAISWQPARVVEVLANGRFRVKIRGEDDFVEEYGSSDEQTEWRLPGRARLQSVRRAYAAGEEAYRATQALVEPHVPPAAAGSELPVVGEYIEVEVEEGETGVQWHPAVVERMIGLGRFAACINGEASFVEEYGPEDEGTEWRRPPPERVEAVMAAFLAAKAAWEKWSPHCLQVHQER